MAHSYAAELPDYDYDSYPVSLGFQFSVKESIPRTTTFDHYGNIVGVKAGNQDMVPPHARSSVVETASTDSYVPYRSPVETQAVQTYKEYDFPTPPKVNRKQVPQSFPLQAPPPRQPLPAIPPQQRQHTFEHDPHAAPQFIDSSSINEHQRNPLPEISAQPPIQRLSSGFEAQQRERYPRDMMLEKYPPGVFPRSTSQVEPKTDIKPDIEHYRPEIRPDSSTLTRSATMSTVSTSISHKGEPHRPLTARAETLTTMLLKSDNPPKAGLGAALPEDRQICDYNLRHAALDIELEHYETAEKLLLEVSEIMGGQCPELTNFYAMRTSDEIDANQYPAAETWLRKLIAYNGTSTTRLHQLSLIQAQQDKSQEALMTAQYITEMSGELHLHVAELHLKVRHFNDAKLHAEKAVESLKASGPQMAYLQSLEVMIQTCEELKVACGPYRRMLMEENRKLKVQTFKVVEEDEDMVFVDNVTAFTNLFRLTPKAPTMKKKKPAADTPSVGGSGDGHSMMTSNSRKKSFWKK